MTRARAGQSIIEYTMIGAIITVVLFYMGTGIKRGMQSLVKITADQVGNEQNSDQDFNDFQSGYMNSSNTTTEQLNNKEVTELGWISNITNSAVYIGNTSYNEYTQTQTDTITNAGFNPQAPGQ